MGRSALWYVAARIAALTFVSAAIIALAWIRTPAPSPAQDTPGVPAAELPAPYFIDHFQGLDEAGRWRVSDGWHNGVWVENEWRRDQVSQTKQGLALTLEASPDEGGKPFVSGEISTHETYLRGYFEVRLRMPKGAGLVGGVFTFSREGGPASWNEIDMEIAGRDTLTLELASHVGGVPDKTLVHLQFDAAEGFHTYGFEWGADVVRWYVDNQLVHEERGERITHMNRPQRFIINLWNSRLLNRWVGDIDGVGAPWTMVISCAAAAPAYEGRALCDS